MSSRIFSSLRDLDKEAGTFPETPECSLLEELKELNDEIREIRREIRDNQEKNEKALEGIRSEIEKKKRMKVQLPKRKILVPARKSPVSIREKVLGEWKMTGSQNPAEYLTKICPETTAEDFTENIKFELNNKKLSLSSASCCTLVEGEEKDLYVEQDHIRSSWASSSYTIDRFLEAGKLHVVENYFGTVVKRFYQKIQMATVKNLILFTYTALLFGLHLYAFFRILPTASDFDYSSHYSFLFVITSLQYLDIVFSFFLTRSNPVAVFVQVTGRLLVLHVATLTVGWKPAVFLLVFVYLLSELCRGPYYLSNCLDISIKQLTWLRYNAFKVLYPIGFFCEALVFINAFLQSGPVPLEITNSRFLFALIFPIIFLSIARFLYTSMSRKAAKKNKMLDKDE